MEPQKTAHELKGSAKSIRCQIGLLAAIRVPSSVRAATAPFVVVQFGQAFINELRRLLPRPPAKLFKVKLSQCPHGVLIDQFDYAPAIPPRALAGIEGADRSVNSIGVPGTDPFKADDVVPECP